MKIKLSIFFFLVCVHTISGQVTITPGAQLYMSGNALLTFQNINLVNNGSFTAGNGIVSFTGSTSSSISGIQPVQFCELEINKTAGSSVSLQRMVSVTQKISFIGGFLNLNSFDIDLGTTGMLNGEQETRRIIGPNGGQVLFSIVLNAPAAINPANLGAVLTSSQNMGNVIIKRGHQSQVNGTGQGNSILRYFDIAPSNNTGLNATLRFRYFDGELYAPLNENSLLFWKSINNSNWTNEGFTSRDVAANYVEKTGIPDFSRWTLSGNNNALPVQIILFNSKCEGNRIIINWKTAQEQNSSHFNIERSTDGINWTVIGDLPAAGNSNTERNYSFSDNNPVQNNYYRIAQFDIDGRVHYTGTLKASCNVNEVFNVWPNPFNEMVFVNISVVSRSEATIKIYDDKGALIKTQTTTLLQGSNQFSIDLKHFASAMYLLVAEWNNGQMKRTKQVIKK